MHSSKNESPAPAKTEQPKVFTFNPSNAPIRVQVINKEPWFVAKDVCSALSISNSRDAVNRLDDDEKAMSVLPTQFGEKEMNLVNESGLYNLIFQSRKPEAKAFRKWVTGEVLPQIRKTGVYSMAEHPEELELRFCKATLWRHHRFGVPQLMAPRKGEWIDLRDVPFTRIPLNGFKVRCVEHNDILWYSINDILRSFNCSTSSCDVARNLNINSSRTLAQRLFIFGNTHPAWFCTRTGMDLIICTKEMEGGSK